MKKLEDLGFKKNNKNINGFRPHYKRNNDLLFLIGSDFWVGKICDIKHAYKDSLFTIWGIITEKAPFNAEKDWVTVNEFILLKLEPLSVGQWAKNGNEIEYIEL
ncbi:hypothetical protein AAGV28_06940 [Flavobacterium sp. FZUC8N2.13]|uniref:DUF551 domain-containing protein n=1 Tax=Flavobacterium zubiriense TaxID=3138075 RepID=A0ABV4TAW0_9FLAO